jgi:hypothetical protein
MPSSTPWPVDTLATFLSRPDFVGIDAGGRNERHWWIMGKTERISANAPESATLYAGEDIAFLSQERDGVTCEFIRRELTGDSNVRRITGRTEARGLQRNGRGRAAFVKLFWAACSRLELMPTDWLVLRRPGTVWGQ